MLATDDSLARLYAEAQDRTRHGAAVGTLLHALGHHQEVEGVLRTGRECLVDLTSVDLASLYDYGVGRGMLVGRTSVGLAPDDVPAVAFPLAESPHVSQIAKRTVLSTSALAVLAPILEEVVGWERAQIRTFFERNGMLIQEWERVRTDWLTVRPAIAPDESEPVGVA